MPQTTSAIHATAATGITIAGVVTGLNFEILLAGFGGALVSLSYLDGMSTLKRCWSLITSTITAGYTAPTMQHYVNKLVGAEDTGGGIFTAFLVGMVAQVAIPGVIKLVKTRLAKLEPKPLE